MINISIKLSCILYTSICKRERKEKKNITSSQLSKNRLVVAMYSNSVGEFREGEIDGKPFLIYTLLSQTESPSSGEAAVDSDGGDGRLSLEPRILCPTLRLKVKKLKPYTRDSNRSFFPMVVSPHFPTIQSGHEQPEYMLHSDSFHQDCIYFPYVIKISRHHHRISYTSSLPSGKWSCGVCRQMVDNDYGAYSCNKCDDYFVHSRCALRRDLWDGIELEGVSEEPEIVVEPFITISDGIILHFSHGHHLKLKISRVYDEKKVCQACILPIYEGSYYSCMDECDFILHEACANAPCKKHHALRPHPLTLTVITSEYEGNVGRFCCNACQRESCGFVYEDLGAKIEEEESAICQICQQREDECATLPYKARYQHDKHFLKFYETKEANDHSEWCDACEGRILDLRTRGTYSCYADLRTKGFYSCDDCCTTLHIDCLLGEDMYMKPGHTIMYNMTSFGKHHEKKLHILRNNTLSRPFCSTCEQHCRQKIVFKYKDSYIFCAVSCQKHIIHYS
ncbi:hypothetical protein AtNW77_Chr5g0084921 [Arabidopsis thaliana]